MDFKNYAERINSLKNFDSKKTVTTSVVKTKFSQLSDKHFYFPNAIISLP